MSEYHTLRPRQLVQKRAHLPVAYIGLGILEWHGLHNPLGLDGLKANGIASYLAGKVGGVVMPPLYWGDNRNEICELVFDPSVSPWLPPGTEDHTQLISEHMGIDKSSFQQDAARSTAEGGWQLWERLMVHTLFQIETLGFSMIVPIPGHYPLFGPLNRAIESYKTLAGSAHIFVLKDSMFSPEGDAGDHAAAFETSLMMAIQPDLVCIEELGDDLSRPNIGVLGRDPRVEASREFGQKILTRFEELIRGEIHQRLGQSAPSHQTTVWNE